MKVFNKLNLNYLAQCRFKSAKKQTFLLKVDFNDIDSTQADF